MRLPEIRYAIVRQGAAEIRELQGVRRKGTSRADAEALFDKFHHLVTGTLPESEQGSLGALRALGGVSRFPLRVKCASLAWHALHAALESKVESVPVVSTDAEGGGPGEGA